LFLLKRVVLTQPKQEMAPQQPIPSSCVENTPAVIGEEVPFVSLFGPPDDRKRKASAPLPPSVALLLETPSADNSRKRLFASMDATTIGDRNEQPNTRGATPTIPNTLPQAADITLPTTLEPPTSASSNTAPKLSPALRTANRSAGPTHTATPPSATIKHMHIFERKIEAVVTNRFQEVQKILEPALLTYLAKERIEFQPLLMQLMLLGDTEDDAKPWIVILCRRKAKHQVKKFIKKRTTKNMYQASRLGQPSFDVMVVGRPLQKNTSGTLYEVFAVGQNSVTSKLWVPRIKITHSGSPHYATLGGFVRIVNSHGKVSTYGLTAGHILPADELYDQDSATSEIVDDSDMGEVSEASDETSDEEHSGCSSKDRSRHPEVTNELSDPSAYDCTTSAGDSDNPEDTRWASLGKISGVSYSRRARDRDWALVELTALHNGQLQVTDVPTSGEHRAACPANEECAIVHNSSQQQGIISASPARAILSSGHNFVDVYKLKLHEGQGI
jgi:hypothetical protein